jgi:selenide, water dikinase
MLTSGDKTNRAYVGTNVQIDDSISADLVKLFFDPQTAGGMLIALPVNRADDLIQRLRKHYPHAAVIGRVVEKGDHAINIV